LRIKLICLLTLVFLSISACTPMPDCSRKDVFCAALVTDIHGLNDYGINQDTWAGLTQSKADGVVDQIANIESVDTRDYEKNIAFFVNAGYDVIITSGVGLRAATLHSADLYPASVFVGMNQTDDASVPNFISVTFPEDQMGFLAGALAAQLTHTNIIGAVCETSSLDSMWRYCEGFRAGARYINMALDVIVVYRDNGSSDKLFIDDAWGAENAQMLIQRGADVIFAVGGETGAAALRTATEAKIRSIGAERDQGAVLAEEGASVVTSVLGRASFTVQELMRRVKGGDLSDSNTSPIGYVSLDTAVPNSISSKMAEILAGLSSGEIKTNVTYKKP
jgi:basic membrane protein A and related proteins